MAIKENEDSIRIARKYLDSLVVEGRIIGACLPTCRVSVLGVGLETPIMTGALSHLKAGMAGFAKGAEMAGALCSIGMGDNAELEAAVDTGARVIKVIKPYADREEIFSRIRFAEEIGAVGVGMDVEHSIEDGVNSQLGQFAMKLPALEELRDYIKATKLPFFIKGALSVQDALTAQKLGAKGVILSHHNSIMKCATPPAFLLPDISRAVGRDFLLIADGGIEDGYDAFKMLALGADLVCVGKPLMKAYSADGPQGIANLIADMTKELKDMLARTGSPDPCHIDPSVIRQAFWLQ